MGLMIVGIILGGLITIFITIYVESQRKPRLRIGIVEPLDRSYEGRPAKKARFLNVNVINKPLPPWASWMSRSAALQCSATISFHHLDGQNVFGRTMQGRWSKTPEPAVMQTTIGDKRIVLVPIGVQSDSRKDIYPSDSELLNVVAKFDEEADCFGWNNDSYFSNPIWRNTDWRLSAGRYLVRIEVSSSGEKVTSLFRLINDVPQGDFRLENAQASDVVYD
jgi:hypothetical protein